jgi:hypothetical protein
VSEENAYKYINDKWVPAEAELFIVPDEAISYIISRYLQGKNTEGGVPVVTGISTQAVREVLRLFVQWAGRNDYIKDGILTMGGHKIG